MGDSSLLRASIMRNPHAMHFENRAPGKTLCYDYQKKRTPTDQKQSPPTMKKVIDRPSLSSFASILLLTLIASIKRSAEAIEFTRTMAVATGPVAVGTRGTIATLVREEVEYFHGLERESSSLAGEQALGRDSSTSFGFLRVAWGRKGRKGVGAFRPSICSIARVMDSYRTNGNRGFNYTLLEDKFENVNTQMIADDLQV